MLNPQLGGIQFPFDGSGRRSTGPAGQRIVAAALRAVDERAAAAVLRERDWRSAYPQHLRALVQAQLQAPHQVVASCRAGLDEAWHTLPFLREGREQPLAEAMLQPRQQLAKLRFRGAGPAAIEPWGVPLGGRMLRGDALARRIEGWRRRGICEVSHAEALLACLAHPEWFDLSDRRLVLLGAASEAGPLAWLARWRANLIAVDLPRPATWQRIARIVREGNATLTAPLAPGEDADIARAGADLLTQAPEIAAWLAGLGGGALDVASLAYLDGERHVRVALAMDAVTALLMHHEPRTTLAWMATPTDVFAVPEALASDVMRAYARRGVVKRVAQAGWRAGSRGSFQPHVEALLDAGGAGRRGIVDALVIEQGPNYALAKRLQQWRAIVARSEGHRVSLHVAPSTTTTSVVKNPLLAAGFRGAGAFGCEVFEPAATSAIIAALWVHDLRNPAAVADPAVDLAHPLDLLCAAANHGGLWRVPYLPRSVLPLAALLGMVRRRQRG